jgi:hypothetical protein
MTTTTDTVFGESASLIVEALLPALENRRTDPDGMCRVEIKLEPRLGTPLMRALMRAEAQLLLEDAEILGTAEYEDRTPEQRRLDALLEIGEAIGRLTP